MVSSDHNRVESTLRPRPLFTYTLSWDMSAYSVFRHKPFHLALL